MSNTKRNSCDAVIDELDSPGFYALAVIATVLVVMASSAWASISGLYFALADLLLMVPLGMYLCFTVLSIASSQGVNQARMLHVAIAVFLVYLPAFYLVFTGQVTLQQLLSDRFDPSLNHMPYASIIPWVAVVLIVAPTKDYLAKHKNTNKE